LTVGTASVVALVVALKVVTLGKTEQPIIIEQDINNIIFIAIQFSYKLS
jgi:hypothetical protein|tara:strand:- start:384 stop:530 length:147 start_codon:yes stop_codon:yes gene_type:complete